MFAETDELFKRIRENMNYNFTFEDLMRDEATGERIIKIIQAFYDWRITLVQITEFNHLACKIGKLEFYFTPITDLGINPKEISNHYSILTLANMILNAIMDLNDDDYDYCCEILEF